MATSSSDSNTVDSSTASSTSSGGSSNYTNDAYTVFVLGASGDLAHKKTYPSLYELYLADLLPKTVLIVGYARSAIPDDKFRDTIKKYLTVGTQEQVKGFLSLCIYRSGQYDDVNAFRKVSN